MTGDVPTAAGDAAPESPNFTSGSEESIVEIDEIVEAWSERQHEDAEQTAQMAADREQFVRDFDQAVDVLIRPTMQAAADRLEEDGGAGLVEQHPGGGIHGPRIILWMALAGPLSGKPREDRNPYLRLDADVPDRKIAILEGDMWEKKGSSGPAGTLMLRDVSADVITHRILAILRRASSHDLAADPASDRHHGV